MTLTGNVIEVCFSDPGTPEMHFVVDRKDEPTVLEFRQAALKVAPVGAVFRRT
jgi:hypothetical protein